MPLPSIEVPVEQVKFRFGEKYISESANKKFLGLPYGVYSGFALSVDGNIITLSPDPVSGFSFLRVLSGLDDTTTVDVYTESALTFDMTNWINSYNASVPGVVFPIFIFATASYQFGSTSSARIEFRTTSASSDVDQLLGQVFYDGSDMTVSGTLPLERSNPFAYSNAPLGYGFMQEGQAGSLLAGLDANNEVIAARQDLSGAIWSSLNDRMIEDFGAPSMASRLAKSVRVLHSNTHTLAVMAGSVNVSESFSEVTRLASPLLTIGGGGTETQVGAITAPLDLDRNIAVVVHAGTKERPIDNDTDRLPVFSRLDYDEVALTGTYTCTNGDPNVVGAGTFFLSEAQVGDLIQGPDGLYYAISVITDNLNLVLTSNFSGATGPLSNGIRRRFTLNFKKVVAGSEIATTLDAGDYQFFFGAFSDLATPIFDAAMVMHQGGEVAQIGPATDLVSGRALLDGDAEPSPAPLAGAIQTVKDTGFSVSENAYDFDFDGAATGAAGVVDVTQRGPTGDTGPDGIGAPGPAGPQGPDGVGFDGGSNHASTGGNNHMWIKRAIVDHNALGHNVSYFHTVNSNSFNIDEVLWATAGIWYIEDWGGNQRPEGESWRLTQVTRDSPTQVTLSAATETNGFLSVNIGIALNIAGAA